jgi:hypothetical protein
MSRLLEQLIKGLNSQDLTKVVPQAKQDRQQAEAASGAAIGAILRGLQEKTSTPEGQTGLWDMLKKNVEQGNLPAEAPGQSSGVQVHELDPRVTDEILKGIFGDKAANIENRIGKVVMLDGETTRKIMGAVLPSILGGLFGQAEQSPKNSPDALPDILGKARKELETKQPKSGGLLDAILDRDHDGDVDLSDLAGIFMK